MSSSQASEKVKPTDSSRHHHYWLVGGLIVVVLLLAGIYVTGLQRLVRYGDQRLTSDPAAALVYYRAADSVSFASQNLITKEADTYATLGDYRQSAENWQRLGKQQGNLPAAAMWLRAGELNKAQSVAEAAPSSSKRNLILSKISLEQDDSAKAITQAKEAGADGELQQGLSMLVQNNAQTNEIFINFINILTNAEARKTLVFASSSNVALASVLHAQGLERSAERVLNAQPASTRSRSSYVLLGQVLAAQANTSSSSSDKQALLIKAKVALLEAVKLDPAEVQSHELLQQVYLALGDSKAAENQAQLIQQLKSGRV